MSPHDPLISALMLEDCTDFLGDYRDIRIRSGFVSPMKMAYKIAVLVQESMSRSSNMPDDHGFFSDHFGVPAIGRRVC